MKKKQDKANIVNIPNILAFSRVPLAIAAVIAYPNLPLFLTLIAIALFTDAIDGPLARKMGSVSNFGAILDGISDKLFYFILLVFLVVLAKLNVWQLLLLIMQDIWMAVLVIYILLHPHKDRMVSNVKARLPGKLTSIGQSLALFWLYLGWPYFEFIFYPTVILALVASVDYTLFINKALTGRRVR